MLRQPPLLIDGTNLYSRRKGQNIVDFTNDGADVENDDSPTDMFKNMSAQNLFNNPVSAFLATLSSIIFWCTYWMAKALIVVAGVSVMISLTCPHKLFELFNHFMDQQKVEKQFREEL